MSVIPFGTFIKSTKLQCAGTSASPLRRRGHVPSSTRIGHESSVSQDYDYSPATLGLCSLTRPRRPATANASIVRRRHWAATANAARPTQMTPLRTGRRQQVAATMQPRPARHGHGRRAVSLGDQVGVRVAVRVNDRVLCPVRVANSAVLQHHYQSGSVAHAGMVMMAH